MMTKYTCSVGISDLPTHPHFSGDARSLQDRHLGTEAVSHPLRPLAEGLATVEISYTEW